MKEKFRKRLNAKVVLCKCPNHHKDEKDSRLFGIRIEEQDSDWIRTWAFKTDLEKAHREGFDSEVTSGAMQPSSDYPGCPYCGTMNIAQCICGNIFCGTPGKTTLTCPWCGQTGEYQNVSKINVRGGNL
ncbi:MAG: hypothetical protein LBR10_00720 [Prevotellaceae bacterium]|jgi:hypothetical protein|nr:hypothetical protein [Prevotellaceae bacterium]